MIVATVLATGAGVAALSASAWGSSLSAEQRLLPGTQVAGVDVGGLTLADADVEVSRALDRRLDHEVVLVHDRWTWRVTPRQLGATTDTDVVLASARTVADAASVSQLAGIRWLGRDADLDLEVSMAVPDEPRTQLVERIATRLDREPVDADLRWRDDQVHVVTDRSSEQVDRDTLSELLDAALAGGSDRIHIPTDEVRARFTTAHAERALAEVQDAVDAALDREVSLIHGDGQWAFTPREVEATPDIAAVTAAALLAAVDATDPSGADAAVGASEHGDTNASVGLTVDPAPVTAVVDEIAGGLDIAARNARLDTASGWVEIVPGRAGRALDRDAAAAELLAALTGVADTVELRTGEVAPAVTSASFGRVLLVRQDLRRLFLYVDGGIAREWPVAVGTGGSPTPTGTFVVGARRFEPTWVNPALDRWGADMPARIGPGPDNPLGLRALNWNRPGGGDTLIRFHGTPNEASIGQAASNGCVRMFNDDVIELYDLVSSGTTIVSVG